MNFEDVYKTHWQKIYRLCLGYVNDPATAKDLAQESFLAAWNNLASFRNESAPGTWIFRIATNVCLRHIQKEKRHEKAELPLNLADENEHDPEPKIKFLYQCISTLPELDRIIISLELEELPQAEIASITGLTEGNVRVRVHRIKEKLTKLFKQNEQRY